MSKEYKSFVKGISLIPKASTGNEVKGDLEVLSSDTKLNYHNGTDSSFVVTEIHASQGANRLKNKDLEDDTTAIVDISDVSKKIKFDAAGTSGTTTTIQSSQTTDKTLILPNISDTLVSKNTIDTFTNKTFDTADAGNVFKINTVQLTNVTGSNDVVLSTSPTITTPTINQINNLQTVYNTPTIPLSILSDSLLTLSGVGQIQFDVSGTLGAVKISPTTLGIDNGLSLTFTDGINSIGFDAPSITDTYTISLPATEPTAGKDMAIIHSASGNYIWAEIAIAKVSKYTFVVGSAAEVSAGTADYSSLSAAITALPAGGGSLLITSNYSGGTTSFSKSKVLIEGQGYNSLIAGDLTIGGNYCSVSNLKISGNLGLSGSYNMVTNFWIPSSSLITDAGTANYIIGVQE